MQHCWSQTAYSFNTLATDFQIFCLFASNLQSESRVRVNITVLYHVVCGYRGFEGMWPFDLQVVFWRENFPNLHCYFSLINWLTLHWKLLYVESLRKTAFYFDLYLTLHVVSTFIHLYIYREKNFVPWKWTNFYIILPRYWTPSKADQKRMESYKMWCWRKMEKISWTDSVKNEELLQNVKE